jgi:hypothetical protein
LARRLSAASFLKPFALSQLSLVLIRAQDLLS